MKIAIYHYNTGDDPTTMTMTSADAVLEMKNYDVTAQRHYFNGKELDSNWLIFNAKYKLYRLNFICSTSRVRNLIELHEHLNPGDSPVPFNLYKK